MSGRRIFRPYGSGRVPKHLNSVAYPEEPATQATFGPSKANVPLSKVFLMIACLQNFVEF